MPLIARVIAKALVLIDTYTSYFVTAEITHVRSYEACANFVVLNVEITDCGQSVVTWLSTMTSIVIWLVDFIVPYLLMGLVAV